MLSRKEIDVQLFEKYEKNKDELSVTGGNTNTWFWRIGEIQFAQFNKKDRFEKEKHLKYLLSLPPENRSTNDDYILKYYGPAEVKKQLHYFSIEENEQVSLLVEQNLSSTEEHGISDVNAGTSTIDEIELIKNIPNLSKKDIKELIDDYYANDYPKWEIDLHNSKLENFINNTKPIYKYTSYIIGLLTTYKNL
jgi:hypothetical protein